MSASKSEIWSAAATKSALALASVHGHGWTQHARYSHEDPLRLDVSATEAEMSRVEGLPDARQLGEGIRPALVHETGTGRLAWMISDRKNPVGGAVDGYLPFDGSHYFADDGDVLLVVSRPLSALLPEGLPDFAVRAARRAPVSVIALIWRATTRLIECLAWEASAIEPRHRHCVWETLAALAGIEEDPGYTFAAVMREDGRVGGPVEKGSACQSIWSDI